MTDPNNKPYPQEFYCPITQEVMIDPVIGKDGHTYEREAIEKWLKDHNVSPMTREPMSVDHLVPNIALRNTIEQIVNENENAINTGARVLGSLPSSSTVSPSSPHHVANVDLTVKSHLRNDGRRVHVRVQPPIQGAERQPCNLVCIIDISGSMGSDAEEASTNATENAGFSRLDLVKHSVRTFIEVLNDKDCLSLIPFSDKARIDLSLTKMSAYGKKKAIDKLEKMQPEGSTNVWDGLRCALEMCKDSPLCTQTNTCVILFTDGESNINPPRGIIPSLEKHIKDNPLNATIHSFGFGYSLDSKLLTDIALHGSGFYSYIPDCTMVGTVFVNLLSNVLSTIIRRADLILTPLNGATIKHVYGSSLNAHGNAKNDSESIVISMGGIQYEQTRDYIVDVVPQDPNAPCLKAELKFNSQSIEKMDSPTEVLSLQDLNELNVQYSRLLFIDSVEKGMGLANKGSVDGATKVMKEFLKQVQKLPSHTDERIKSLMRDVESDNQNEGQVSQAFSRSDWYQKWGRHYLPSLLRANWMQTCHNFKDPSVQVFGGDLFKSLQNVADDIFCKLPPPKASNKERYDRYTGTYTSSTYTPVNMSAYYNAGGSCFDGDSQVLLADHSLKKVRDIQKGDKLKNMNGSDHATVLCVLKSKTPSSQVKLCDLNGMKITPYHPVRVNGEWKFPIDIATPKNVTCDYVYNLVVDQGHVVSINGVECITLGHGFSDNSVISHPYFGTSKIVEDLRTMKGFNEGLVEMTKYKIMRDPNSGKISSLSLVE
ncbi:hypothetical protein C9374_001540 [Naegleria lovaniensis]|uniref:U-box domain-containing protein n=1 Tax=Naegleria lovaniensis TaxID=51637 RepID=A0AA88GWT8_NAELO|nr:uncharacterized protein C9374_001540 [Naegleria lovaniensis]KAG2387208.1 hypothetical protein C9374_001540 [Naegleria lovaniensis]